jgi:hypothetical protein
MPEFVGLLAGKFQAFLLPSSQNVYGPNHWWKLGYELQCLQSWWAYSSTAATIAIGSWKRLL